MKLVSLQELIPDNSYYINTTGLLVKENEQGPQPHYHSKEKLVFKEIINEYFGKFEKKINDHLTVVVTRNTQLYDIYEPQRELVYTKTMKNVFEKYLDDTTSISIAKTYFIPP
jgi:hypothetical protein